ncbi:MAG: alpha/beta hydrolase [Candidatus Dormibacteraeota bacterium]|nr:alpha/beta hydrolase [Candidatus Dormibacteraeota bacterium]
MTEVSEGWVRSGDGARIWMATTGRGTDLALAHGGPGLWDYLEPLAEFLRPYARTHRWDQRGGGRSSGPDTYTVERFVADMEDVREASGAQRWIAGGHSWGATLALLYALRYPDRTLGVLYVAGIGTDWSRWRHLHRAEVERRLGPDRWERLQSTTDEREANRLRWSTDYVSEEVGRPWVERMLTDRYSVNRRCNQALQAEIDTRARALFAAVDNLRVPVLVVQGAADPRPVAACDDLVARLPFVRRMVLDGAGHFPWVEQPDKFRSGVTGWLREVR